MERWAVSLTALFTTGLMGCHHPQITAVPLSTWNRCEPEGIPFYLPKPLLIVAKNVRSVETAKTGLTAPAPSPTLLTTKRPTGTSRLM